MFANRFTALIDACTLACALRRNLLLSLAESEFFRPRRSEQILAETEKAIENIVRKKGLDNPSERAMRACKAMRDAFKDANVAGFEPIEAGLHLPDLDDCHVVAAAIKTTASIIVTENIKDFPPEILAPLSIEVKTADEFIADTIDLSVAIAIPAIRTMRKRLKRPEKTAAALILDLERYGLTMTADAIRDHEKSL